MGFPDMKYLDPEAKGQPIQEKTLYKEYLNIKDNDIKNKREEGERRGVRRSLQVGPRLMVAGVLLRRLPVPALFQEAGRGQGRLGVTR